MLNLHFYGLGYNVVLTYFHIIYNWDIVDRVDRAIDMNFFFQFVL